MHIDQELLTKIMAFDTADRTQAFVKNLMKAPLMAAGELPPPTETAAVRQRRESLRTTLLEPHAGFANDRPEHFA